MFLRFIYTSFLPHFISSPFHYKLARNVEIKGQWCLCQLTLGERQYTLAHHVHSYSKFRLRNYVCGKRKRSHEGTRRTNFTQKASSYAASVPCSLSIIQPLILNWIPVMLLWLSLSLIFWAVYRHKNHALHYSHTVITVTYPVHSNPCNPVWAGAGKHRSLHSFGQWLGCETCSTLCCCLRKTAMQRRLSTAWPPAAPAGTHPHPETAIPGPESHSGLPRCLETEGAGGISMYGCIMVILSQN